MTAEDPPRHPDDDRMRDEVRGDELYDRLTHPHSWQPGPLVPGIPSSSMARLSTPASVVLVCACGELRRVRVPPDILFAVEGPRVAR